MASISETARIVGVARSTLLYYEKIGIISPTHNPENGYRDYSPEDIDSLLLVRHLTQAGFTLKEAADVMSGTLDPDILGTRYHNLESQLKSLLMAREVIGTLISRATGKPPKTFDTGTVRDWHAEFERNGSAAHAAWLRRLGFSEKECLYIRWVTRNIANVETYMDNFFTVFEQMNRQGPGSKESTLQAFGKIPNIEGIGSILDVGCGSGASSLVLAEHTDAVITAVDNHQPFLDRLTIQARKAGLADRIIAMNRSMFALEFPANSFDCIWAEGSAYIMGFEQALREWRPLLKSGGHLFISDAVWLTRSPSPACADYWRIEYPAMTDVETRKTQAQNQDYNIVSWFILPRADWAAFYNDMEDCVNKSIDKHGMTPTFADMLAEINIDRHYGEEYGYLCLLLTRNN